MRVNPNLLIKTLKQNNRRVAVTAMQVGVHPTTVYRWKKRAGTTRHYLKQTSLRRISTRPHRIHRTLSGHQETAIATLRREKGYTASKIRRVLGLVACPLTIHRFLKRRGFVREYGYYRRPRFQETVHMHRGNVRTIGYLQMDVKYITPELSGLPWTCFEYAVIDIFSRYKEAVILNHLDQDGSMAALLEILPQLPFRSVFIQTDNGLEFQERFHRFCEDMGFRHHFIHKNTPNENALIERSFRTDEEEFFFRLDKAPQHYDELRQWFAGYLHEYNYERPHLGIDLKTPYEVVANVVLD